MMIYHNDNINMLKGIYSQANGFTQVMITLFVSFSSLILCMAAQFFVLWFVCKPESWEVFNEMMSNDISLLKLTQAVQAIGLFIFPAFIAAFLLTENSISDYLSLKNAANIDLYILVAMAAIVALPLVNSLAELNNNISLPAFFQGFENWARELENSAKELTEKFLSVSTIPGLLVNLFVIAVLAAVGEELIFRGVLQRIFSHWTKSETLGIWITAFVFSVVH
ncbi:MAG: CPBP family intramembrane metalloprotease, partial [Prevotellaceae bacterium]|nr:CPBP family intramembrane metalloprotease [Prevotellaceae bacterium]